MAHISIIVPSSLYTQSLNWDSTIRAPLEGVSIAATLVFRQYPQIKCEDLRVRPCDLDRVVARHSSSDLVLLSGTPDGYRFVKEFTAALRQAQIQKNLKRSTIILGGALASISWRTVLEKTGVDCCLVGDIERTLIPVIKDILSGREPGPQSSAAWRNPDGAINTSNFSASCSLPEMDEVPCPEYHLWRESHGNGLSATVCYSTQRGCPSSCNFCANPSGRQVRLASVAKVKRDLQHLKGQGFKSVCFNDPTFNTDEDRCLEIAGLMRSLELPWVCLMRARPCNASLLKTLKRSFCQTLLLGVESADQNILDAAVKGERVEDIETCIRYAAEAGLPTVGFFILGLPGETEATLRKMKQFTLANPFYPRPFYAVPYPGTALYDQYRLATIKAGQSNEDHEESVLLRLSDLKYDGSDEPFELPGRQVQIADLKQMMRWARGVAIARDVKVLG